MITTVLFDLDGTLLPMDEKVFITAYLGGLSRKMAPHGYEPEKLVESIWLGTGAMVKNDGIALNEQVFWNTFSSVYGRDTRVDEPLFESFYQKEFQEIRHVCGFDPRASETITTVKAMGLKTILATNPLFPAIATHSRVRWAGLKPTDFEHITTYENASFCKPNPNYYLEILRKCNLKPEECLMVGNDAQEDMVAQSLGMQVFLMTDCLIDRSGQDLSHYPQGSFPELLAYIRSLLL